MAVIICPYIYSPAQNKPFYGGRSKMAPGQRRHPVKDGTRSKTFTLAHIGETRPYVNFTPDSFLSQSYVLNE